MSEVSTSFEVSGHRGLYVFSVLALLGLVAMLCYAWHKNALLDAQAPIITTCVQHRITQKVEVLR